jgi:hypothetical protein
MYSFQGRLETVCFEHIMKPKQKLWRQWTVMKLRCLSGNIRIDYVGHGVPFRSGTHFCNFCSVAWNVVSVPYKEIICTSVAVTRTVLTKWCVVRNVLRYKKTQLGGNLVEEHYLSPRFLIWCGMFGLSFLPVTSFQSLICLCHRVPVTLADNPQCFAWGRWLCVGVWQERCLIWNFCLEKNQNRNLCPVVRTAYHLLIKSLYFLTF